MDIPTWRTIKNTGEMKVKYHCGAESNEELLEKERHTVIRKGKRYFVKDFERYLV